ncbi:putative ATP-grasp-modified RiPP [Streptomyces olivoreticuli]|uniref:putative ATP-grasp-modified RiPP n=1 Tax=Streptomyces olivoreticuli TaxID=68246 RepID=UPI00265B4B7F|nr:putative ATP-grasp-modified RiPP [Streptomyces olivoreticuli]WKK21306.1 putative ATP-grasp-modified RiPP [Streptomyces olivoreticuli]
MPVPDALPWGLTRMAPFPEAVRLPYERLVLDPGTQIPRRLDENGNPVPVMEKHKRSETSKETSTRTSLDGTSDQGSDQEGDTD